MSNKIPPTPPASRDPNRPITDERDEILIEDVPPYYPYLYAQGKQWVPLEDVRKAWQAWKQAIGDSEEAYALMEMDSLLGVGEDGNPL